jgi:dTDP-4-dehydrorhamnose 3,5-epimerase
MEHDISVNPVRIVTPRRFGDDRGWFSETYNEKSYHAIGLNHRFVQDNHSLSRARGTLRGIHFQTPPHGQHKLVRCVRGRILDIAVDLRGSSPTYGKWVGAELSAENGRQLFVPIGFGHAFLTLEPDTEVIYKVTDYYAPECDGGIRWNDPDIGVEWDLSGAEPQLSNKDSALPFLRDFDSPFAYDGRPLTQLEYQAGA